MSPFNRFRLPAALLAVASVLVAASAAGLAVESYSHLRHPLALLGARQLGMAGTAFGLFAFVLPGLAGAWIALALRPALPAGSPWSARIGTQMLLLAALAAAAQGVLPLDLEQLDGGGSRGHATAWLLWALALPGGALLLALGTWQAPGWRRFAALTLLAGGVVLAGGFLGSGWIGAPLAQRLALAAWLLWGVLAARPPGAFSRGAASGLGSAGPGPG